MKNVISVMTIIFLFCFLLPSGLTAQEATSQIIKGQVSEIAEDGSYIIVNETKIITDQEFIKDYLVEKGDVVEVTADLDEDDLVAAELSFIYDEEETSSDE